MQGKPIGNIVGLKYGRLTIFAEDGRGYHRRALCVCECGTQKSIRLDSLRRGEIVSCGCYNKEISSSVNSKHGMYRSRIYKIWAGMKGRCLSPTCNSFDHYGGRGITICKEWLVFNNFHTWAIENGYCEDLTIERKNNDGNYEPSNCTWISVAEQRRNTTRVPGVYFNGQRKTLRQWAKIVGISSSNLCYRLKSGWTLEDALTIPSKGKHCDRSALLKRAYADGRRVSHFSACKRDTKGRALKKVCK